MVYHYLKMITMAPSRWDRSSSIVVLSCILIIGFVPFISPGTAVGNQNPIHDALLPAEQSSKTVHDVEDVANLPTDLEETLIAVRGEVKRVEFFQNTHKKWIVEVVLAPIDFRMFENRHFPCLLSDISFLKNIYIGQEVVLTGTPINGNRGIQALDNCFVKNFEEPGPHTVAPYLLADTNRSYSSQATKHSDPRIQRRFHSELYIELPPGSPAFKFSEKQVKLFRSDIFTSTITIHGNATTKILSQLALLPNLTKITFFGHSELSKMDLSALENHPRLYHLSFTACLGFSDKHCAEIGKFTRLNELRVVSNVDVTNTGVTALAKSNSIRVLSLPVSTEADHINVTVLGINSIGTMKALEILELRTGSWTGKGVDSLRGNGLLRELIVAGDHLQSDQLALISKINTLKYLTVSLPRYDSTFGGAMGKLPAIESVTLEGGHIEKEFFSSWGKCSSLSELNFRSVSFRAIPSSHHSLNNFVNLSHLGLLGARLDDSDAERLVGSLTNPLYSLDMTGNYISDEFIEYLSRSRSGSSVHRLFLSDTEITDESLKFLLNFDAISFVGFPGQISDRAVEEYSRAKPKVSYTH